MNWTSSIIILYFASHPTQDPQEGRVALYSNFQQTNAKFIKIIAFLLLNRLYCLTIKLRYLYMTKYQARTSEQLTLFSSFGNLHRKLMFSFHYDHKCILVIIVIYCYIYIWLDIRLSLKRLPSDLCNPKWATSFQCKTSFHDIRWYWHSQWWLPSMFLTAMMTYSVHQRSE